MLILNALYNMTLNRAGRHAVVLGLSHRTAVLFLASALHAQTNSVQTQYIVILLLLTLKLERNVFLTVDTAPDLYTAISSLDNASLTSELRSKIQQLLQWIKPAVRLKEKGVR
jgi:hypothetical protein